MLLKIAPKPIDYNNPEPTADYKVRKGQAELEEKIRTGRIELKRPEVGDVISKGIDVNSLKAKYDPAKETGIRWLYGVYRVPIGISLDVLKAMDKEKVTTWISIMEKQGWEWIMTSPIRLANGVYPARYLDDNSPDLAHRERIISTQFRKKDIQIIKTELRPELVKPLVVGDNGNVIPKY